MIDKDKQVIDTTILTEETPSELIDKIDLFINQITNPKISVFAIDTIADDEIKEVSKLSQILNTPISNISKDDSEGNKIGLEMKTLRNKIEEINPSKHNFDDNFIDKFIQKFTGKSSINKYFSKLETHSVVISDIVKNLEDGGEKLRIESNIFREDKLKLDNITKRLQSKINILNHSSIKLNELIDTTKDEDRKRFLQQDVDYRLQQQILDLQQVLITAAQGVISLDILVKNNNELIRSVNRIKNVTLVALNVGVMVSIGLANQKRVLDTTKSVLEATNNIIETNAQLLKTQGVEIQKQASNSILDMEVLQKALVDSLLAIEQAENYRLDALPQMREAAMNTQNLINQFDKKVKLMEQQNKLQIEE